MIGKAFIAYLTLYVLTRYDELIKQSLHWQNDSALYTYNAYTDIVHWRGSRFGQKKNHGGSRQPDLMLLPSIRSIVNILQLWSKRFCIN